MKYTYCETLMWVALAPASFRYLAEQEPKWNIPALKKKSKQIYRQIIARTPDIGTLTKNPLRVCLSGEAFWLAVYEAAEGRMSEKRFGGMVDAGMQSPLVMASFKGKTRTAFTTEAQQKRAAVMELGNATDEPFYWGGEVVFGRDSEEYTIIYRKCGLCALGRQEGLAHLVPHLCSLDTMSIDWMGGRLYRTKTLATGCCCDFYICKKGSQWEKEREGNASQWKTEVK